jgi:hypothetical protein
LFCPVQPAAPTVSASGSHSIAAGTYAITITAIGWDGGETAQSPIAYVTVNGSQGILVNYVIPSGMQGIFIFVNGTRQENSFLTGSSVTLTTISSDGSAPQLDGTGLPCILSQLIIAPEIILANGINKLTLAPPTLTNNRAMNYADGANSADFDDHSEWVAIHCNFAGYDFQQSRFDYPYEFHRRRRYGDRVGGH